MSSEIMHNVLELIESEVQRRLTPIDFEMAYQVRVAIDRIKFGIKHLDQSPSEPDGLREAGLQLVDALDRLESAERKFQRRFRSLEGHADSKLPSKVGNGLGPAGRRGE